MSAAVGSLVAWQRNPRQSSPAPSAAGEARSGLASVANAKPGTQWLRAAVLRLAV